MHRYISHNKDDLEDAPLTVTKKSPSRAHDQDQLLWDEFREGCDRAFAMLYQKTFMDLYQYGLKISPQKELVKDCIHDLYVDLWNKKEELKPVDNIKGYLLVALKRRLVNHFNRSKKIRPQGMTLEDKNIPISICREREIIEHQSLKEQKDRIFAALEMLTKRQRKALHLKFYHNYSNQEIAKELALDINSTYNLVSKAVKRLRNSLAGIIIALLLLGF